MGDKIPHIFNIVRRGRGAGIGRAPDGNGFTVGCAVDSLELLSAAYHLYNAMTRSSVCAVLLLLLAGTFLSGCATSKMAEGGSEQSAAKADVDDTNDPFEGFNRAIYLFNDKADRYVLKPIAQGYQTITPAPVRKGVSNFFSNLREPIVFLNNALQGKFGDAASDLGRFLTNSTVGVLGIFDVAQHIGLERHNEDFGQTLGVWGVGEGPYLVLPFIGPSNLRDGPSLYVDHQAHPLEYMEEQSTASKLRAVDVVDTRARLLDAGDILEQAAGEDPYVFVREAYRQRRRSQINDGGAGGSTPSAVDPSIFEDDRPGAKPGGQASPAKP